MRSSEPAPLAVWAATHHAGLLARSADHLHYVFAYNPSACSPDAQVSLTMPVRLESWANPVLHPVFQMNLPEGALLEAIRRAIAKLAGEDDLTVLRVTGGNQVGRNRFSAADDKSPDLPESTESLEELLTYPDTAELFHDLVNRYALRSGVSGVQPKVLLEARDRATAATGSYIVKSWGSEYPQLAANEFFCMTAAKRAGLPVPEFHIAENGGLFLMKRFDQSADGRPICFEDFCTLQGLGTARKYSSTNERVARTISDFVSPQFRQQAREQFFSSLVLSNMLRNGDAHLKNFALLYDRPGTPVRLAPVYDIVTTVAYIPRDLPALSLAGTKKWWSRKMLEKFAVAHLSLSVGTVSRIMEQMAEAVNSTTTLLQSYIREHTDFQDTGQKMLKAWETGIAETVTD